MGGGEDADQRSGAPDEPTVVTVRLTESVGDSCAVLRQLHDLDGTLRFPTLASAYEFEEELNADTDDSYTLTPDHHQDGTTFYLRCNPADE